VRFNGLAYEAIAAAGQHRPRRRLYHAALMVHFGGERYAIELSPAWSFDEAERGVKVTGPVGSRHAGRWRLFRYELRCWRGGTIPDLDHAVGSARRVSGDPAVVRRLLDLVPTVPALVWGRDELGTGDMWNSNSVIAWLIASAGIPADDVGPPAGGGAPGWEAGVALARRQARLLPGQGDGEMPAALRTSKRFVPAILPDARPAGSPETRDRSTQCNEQP
jgi:hypothetical protein